MISAVTSCSMQGWLDYGQRFVAGFREYWPPETRLYIVSEDELPYDNSRPNTIWLSLNDSIEGYEFLRRHKDHEWAMGFPENIIAKFRNQAGYSFRHDAYKFSKKVFAIELVSNRVANGKLFWIDADVVTFAPVSENFLNKVLPQDAALGCLLRPNLYTETGFVGYNLDHPATRPLIARCMHYYASDEVFALNEWHDCWVLDLVRAELKTPTHAIPHQHAGHPFINSELGMYMDHLKGNRKARGRTPIVEQVRHRGAVDYWR
jgi:hypothetical protein